MILLSGADRTGRGGAGQRRQVISLLVQSPDRLIAAEAHANGDAHRIWCWMREHAPVHRHEAMDGFPAFWSVTRHADVRAIYRDPAAFSSAHGVLLTAHRVGDDPGGGLTLALTDPPRHRELRAVVADWFTQRALRGLRQFIHETTEQLLRAAVERGRCEVVDDIVGRCSMAVIGHILGIPIEDHDALFGWTNEAFAVQIPLGAQHKLMSYLAELADERIERPQDDLLTRLVTAAPGGRLLTDEEVLFNCENLIGATENGRLSLAGAFLAFASYPDQWERLRRCPDLLGSAVEEVLRWTSSATHSLRTTTRRVTVRNQEIEAGQKVVLWVGSANRDEEVFTDAHRFDVGRSSNCHLAFGSGEHFCLGALLARVELTILLQCMLDADLRLDLVEAPSFVHSIAVSGPERLVVRLIPAHQGGDP